MSDNSEIKTQNIFKTIEIVSIGFSLGGSIASLIFKQAFFATFPLSITVGLNFFNRQKMIENVSKIPRENKDLITEVNTEFDKLKTENQQLKSHLEKYNLDILPALQNRLNELENNRLNNLEISQANLTEKLENNWNTFDNSLIEIREIINSKFTGKNYFNSSEYYYQRGLNNQNLDNKETAIQDYTIAIQFNRNHGHAYFNRGTILASMGRKQAAIDDLRQASKLFLEQGEVEKYQEAKNATKKLYELDNISHNELDILSLDNLLL